MRRCLPLVLMLAACSQEGTAPSLTTGTFAGEGRDRLCIAGDPGKYRAGLIAYGKGDINCSASGRIDSQDGQLALIPRGDTACRITLKMTDNSVQIGEVPAACSYYCGPGASLGGKSFNRSDMGAEAVDLAGDPLC